ncbi:MAG: DM13 domain-containing protein [Actinomycetota bacterium]
MNEAEAPQPAPKMGRRILTWLGLISVTLSAVMGSNMFGVRDRLLGSATPEPAPPAASRVAGAEAALAATPTRLRSHPWWQDVTTIEGTGNTESSVFTIAKEAIQWRMKWSCPSGRLLVQVHKQAKPVVDAACPGGAFGYGASPGAKSVEVKADGPWRLEISQQVDNVLVEPPLPAMTANGAATVATGGFYKIDRTGTGRVTLFRQADGRYSMRFDDFFVSPNSDLEIRLSTVEAPRTSQEYIDAPSELVEILDVTAGSLNYVVPEGIDPSKYRSVVIWCAPINSAYAAATLVAS